MAEERWKRIQLLVGKALERSPDERAGFLDEACGNDPTLRREVESLLTDDDGGSMGTRTEETLDSSRRLPRTARTRALRAGVQLGPYEIVAPLGVGGMGEVYRANDTRLERTVAIKVLPEHLASGREQKQRFEREAKAISQLNHPHICTLFDVGHQDGVDFLVMEHIEGGTLSSRLDQGPVPLEAALEVAQQIASGLERAHRAGIVHRDLKPGNIMYTETGVKLLDFGLAKVRSAPSDGPSTEVGSPAPSPKAKPGEPPVTRQGTVMGTVPYMAPEQAMGRTVDELSDQFSFGVVLFEMLAGERPFQGDSAVAILAAIVEGAPRSLKELRADTPSDLEAIIARCLEKRPEERFPTMTAVREALERCQSRLVAAGRVTIGWRAVVAVASAAAVVGGLALRDDLVKWSERESLAAVARSTEAGDLYEAFRLSRAVQDRIPNDEEVRKMIDRITIPIAIVTDPPGASVEVAAYDGDTDRWTKLGETPLPEVRVPYALVRWRIAKRGYESFEGAPFGRSLMAFAGGFALDPEGSRPAGMVRVPGGPYQRMSFAAVELESYWLDQYEVTNRDYKDFVDAGGYEDPAYWNGSFYDGDEEISRDEAMTRLVDTTGRSAPAAWARGIFDDGLDDHPVSGVSWYEAAAYCRFVDKSLPSLFHWSAATAQDQLSDIVRVSNFDGNGPVAVGERPGLGDFGTYDMAGNVKEWTWNEGEGGRYILGGAWGEPTSRFRVDAETMPPLSRELTHGFRCARVDEPVDASLLAPVTPSFFTEVPEPVPDEIFDAYRRIYAYDDSELEASVDSVDESSDGWRKETVSFRAAYGGERVIAHLFLPRNASPPYQPVIWFPGNDVFFLSGNEALASPYLFDFVPRGGRALVYPVYKGMYERHVPFTFAPNETRDLLVMWSKDIGRTLDYLELRDDIDTGRAAYYGFSSGALYGPIFTAIDLRFRASILLGGGIDPAFPPEANSIHFAPRSNVPTLMVNGRDDFLSPYEILQKPFFDLLGASDGEKRHARLDGGHIPPDRAALIREVEGWLDRYLGAVSRKGENESGS